MSKKQQPDTQPDAEPVIDSRKCIRIEDDDTVIIMRVAPPAAQQPVPPEAYLSGHTHKPNPNGLPYPQCPACATEHAVAYMQARVSAAMSQADQTLSLWKHCAAALRESEIALKDAQAEVTRLEKGSMDLLERQQLAEDALLESDLVLETLKKTWEVTQMELVESQAEVARVETNYVDWRFNAGLALNDAREERDAAQEAGKQLANALREVHRRLVQDRVEGYNPSKQTEQLIVDALREAQDAE